MERGGQGLEGTLELDGQRMLNRREARKFHDDVTGTGLMC
jgi:hypothetical protein